MNNFINTNHTFWNSTTVLTLNRVTTASLKIGPRLVESNLFKHILLLNNSKCKRHKVVDLISTQK